MKRDIFDAYIQKSNQDQSQEIQAEPIPQEPLYKDIVRDLKATLDAYGNQSVGSKNADASYDLAVVNGWVVIPDDGIRELDIYIRDGKVTLLGERGSAQAKQVIDAKGRYVMPGVVDPHVHIGIYRPFEQEIISESRAALAGGITTIGCFLGSSTTHFKTYPEFERRINADSRVDVVPHLVISSSQQKQEVEDYASLLGVSSFKVYMSGMPGLIPDVDDGFILDMMETLKGISDKCVLCVHSENKSLILRNTAAVRDKHPEQVTLEEWRQAHPDFAEEEACLRMAYYAKLMKTPVYLVHVSTARAMNAMIKEKQTNPYIIIETTSPYLTTNTANPHGHLAKMIPPIGNPDDQDGLWTGISSDCVDTIGTDHVSIKREDKEQPSFWDQLAGYSVLETHLASLINEGVHNRGISLEKIVTKITKNPAEKFNLYPRKGTIQIGSDADLVIMDLDKKQDTAHMNLESLTDFSIYDGQMLKGWPVMTIKGGTIVARDGRVVDDSKRGSCIRTI